MADHFYGVTVPGADTAVGNVTKATSTTSATVELRVHDGVPVSKTELLLAIKALEAYIATDGAPV